MAQNQQVHVMSEIKQESLSTVRSATLWIGALVFGLVAILAFGAVSANKALNGAKGGSSFALNPELSAARRFTEVTARGLERNNLAINPELKLARIDAETASGEPRLIMAVNPELIVAQWYMEAANEVQDKMSARVTNPELYAATRFAEKSAADLEKANLYQNPELKVVASRASITDGSYGNGFLATNPEIKAHQRFVEGVDR